MSNGGECQAKGGGRPKRAKAAPAEREARRVKLWNETLERAGSALSRSCSTACRTTGETAGAPVHPPRHFASAFHCAPPRSCVWLLRQQHTPLRLQHAMLHGVPGLCRKGIAARMAGVISDARRASEASRRITGARSKRFAQVVDDTHPLI